MTLRHDIKARQGDSWTSQIWAVILPGGLGVDLVDGWTVEGTIREKRGGEIVYSYTLDEGVQLGQAEVPLSNGTKVTTSTVELHHSGLTSGTWPLFIGPWDCEIRKDDEVYTIVAGTFRLIGQVTS